MVLAYPAGSRPLLAVAAHECNRANGGDLLPSSPSCSSPIGSTAVQPDPASSAHHALLWFVHDHHGPPLPALPPLPCTGHGSLRCATVLGVPCGSAVPESPRVL
ncbi:hypothetical protein VPH35_104895 [Triticum aestivum]